MIGRRFSLKELTIRQRQYGLALGVGALGAGILAYMVFAVKGQDSDIEVTAQADLPKSSIDGLSNSINPKEVWVERMESQARLTRQEIEGLKDLLRETVKRSQEKEAQLEKLSAQVEKVHGLSPGQALPMPSVLPPSLSPEESQSGAGQSAPNVLPGPAASQVSAIQGSAIQGTPMQTAMHPTMAPTIGKVSLNLKNSPIFGAQQKSTIENTLPAGAYSRAVIMGGVEASTSVSAQSDPRPVLLRLSDHGSLPRRFKSDLKNCRVLASSYGDISSERVYMRLEKLTCTEPLTGEIIETQVSGYVAGEDGKTGVRGVVVDRAGEVMRNTFIAGFVGGISSFFSAQQQRSVFPVSPFGQSHALGSQEMLKSGAAQGAGNAMEKFADFYIKRAEQMQPVIAIAAGREVEVVFTQGTKFGESSVKRTLHKVREQSRQENIEQLKSQGDGKQWLPKYTN